MIDKKDFHPSMRGWFAGHLYNKMVSNPNIVVLTADLGYGQFDKIRKDFPDRFYNLGAAEQSLVDVAVGLSLAGKLPIVYTITPFYLRAAEGISLYLNGEDINVKLIGGGRDSDYEEDGPSHDAHEAQRFLRHNQNILQFYPETNEELLTVMDEALESTHPCFISVRR